MLGVGLLHLLPHSFEATKDINSVVISAMAGLLVIYILLRAFDFHQHAPAEDETEHADHHCDHPHHEKSPSGAWWSMVIGMSIHALVEGVALGASIQADTSHGLAVCLAILLHKPLDSMSVVALLSGAGQPKQKCMMINVMFAMLCPVGAVLTMLFASFSQGGSAADQWWLGVAIGFSAGTFLCISLSDLLPEVQFHRHDKFGLSAAMLLGVALAYGIGFIESQTHDHKHKGAAPSINRTAAESLPSPLNFGDGTNSVIRILGNGVCCRLLVVPPGNDDTNRNAANVRRGIHSDFPQVKETSVIPLKV